MKSDKNCPDIRALVNVYYHWGSHWTPPGRMRVEQRDCKSHKLWYRCFGETWFSDNNIHKYEKTVFSLQ